MPSAIIHVWDVVNNDNKMKKSELRQIIRKVLREEKVGDKEYSAEGSLFWCKASCLLPPLQMSPSTGYIIGGYLSRYHHCIRACNAAHGIRESIHR